MKITSVVFVTLSLSVLTSPVPQSTPDSQSSPINGLLAALGKSPIIGADVTALSGVLTTFEQGLATTLNVDTTQSGVARCTPMTVIFARGTTEPGNVGL